MSKFVDKLQNLFRSPASPIGFRSSVNESNVPAMLLIAGMSRTDVKDIGVAVSHEVDAGLILTQDFNTEMVKQTIKAAGDVPVGILLKDVSGEKLHQLLDSGCDFLVLDTKMPATALRAEGMGKFLAIGLSLDSGLVRAINNLDVDGVFLISDGDSFTTVEHLLIYRRFSELLDKPLIAMLPSPVDTDVLSNLREAGISGVVVPATQPSEAFVELRKLIDSLPKEVKHKRGRASVTLPQCTDITDVEEEEDEEP